MACSPAKMKVWENRDARRVEGDEGERADIFSDVNSCQGPEGK